VTLTFTPGDRVRLTAAIDGDANDVSWRWVPPEGSSAPASTTNVLEWTTGANDAGVYDVEVVSPTASDSPSYGAFSLNLASAFDPDAAVYIAAVEAADGQALEDGVREAINTLVVELKATAGLWGSLDIFAPLAGPRTVAGCAVPLKGAVPFVGTNLTAGDYDRGNGIRGGLRGMTLAPAGYDLAAATGQTKIGVLNTEAVPGGLGWGGGLILQDGPVQRTAITVSVDNSNLIPMVRTNQATALVLPLVAQTMPEFYFVERIDASTLLVGTQGNSFVTRSPHSFQAAQAPIPSLDAFSIGEQNTARVMTAFAGLATGQASAAALQTACLAYRTALATAIPAVAQVQTASDLAAARARTANGQFIADDPSTPDVNEAWTDGRGPA
jgi:hypothetical protein